MIERINKRNRIENVFQSLDSKVQLLRSMDPLSRIISDLISKDIETALKTHISVKVIEIRIVIWVLICEVLKRYKINQIDWNLLCKIYNENVIKLLDDNIEIFMETELNDTANRLLDAYNNRENLIGWTLYYQFIIELYKELSQSILVDEYDNIKEIHLYKSLLVRSNTINIAELGTDKESEFIRTHISNNYPLDSSYKDLIIIKSNTCRYVSCSNTVFYAKSSSETIKELLFQFLSKFCDSTGITLKVYKIFIYYFVESLGGQNICSYKEFSNKTLVTQYRFYDALDLFYLEKGIITDRRNSTKSLIVSFYRYLIEIKEKYSNYSIFNKAFELFLSKRTYSRVLQEGYVPVLHSTHEEPPVYDKYCIIPYKLAVHNSSYRNDKCINIDLTAIHEYYREDVRKFIWYEDSKVYSKKKHMTHLIKFFDYKARYDNRMKNLIHISQNIQREFTEEFLLEYRLHLETVYSESATVSCALKSIRKYLKYFTEKYLMTENDFSILSLAGLGKYNGGQIITPNDLKVIYQEFKLLEKLNNDKRLHTILFEIFIYSNLRIGEILNLKRNCILYSEYDKDISKIRYLSKTGGEEFVPLEVNKIIIDLIEEAIKLTERYVDSSLMSEYIFILPMKRKILSGVSRIDFYSHFNKVLTNVNNKLEKKKYYPYNIRHTAIDTIYREGIENNLTLNEIARIANNTYKTAVRYYRQYDYIDNYVEAISRVRITNVDIHGKILAKENDGLKKKVKGDLGKCSEENCSFEIGECLVCNNFVTFVNRIPNFENAIKSLDKQLTKTVNELEVNEINVQKQLLGKFLSEMYKLKYRTNGVV